MESTAVAEGLLRLDCGGVVGEQLRQSEAFRNGTLFLGMEGDRCENRRVAPMTDA